MMKSSEALEIGQNFYRSIWMAYIRLTKPDFSNQYFSAFKLACDKNGVHEGVTL